MSNAAVDLHREIEAAKTLRDQLADLMAGDPEFIRDTIEGETNLREQIAVLVASIGEDEALANGVKQLIDDLKTREKRLKDRAEMKRALVATAMEIGEIPKLETPGGTVTAKAVPPKAIVTEEADIPARFWKPQPPKLDLSLLTDALKQREAWRAEAMKLEDQEERVAALTAADREHPPIPGATLSNGSKTIQIRRK